MLRKAERRASAVALVYQPYKEAPKELATFTCALMKARCTPCAMHSAFELRPEDARGVDLVITFGGDGTVLRVASWLAAARSSATILPVRMGTLSFLGELQPSEVADHLGPYLEGDYWLDERTMLRAQTGGMEAVALNDVVIGRGAASRAVRLHVWLDEAHLTSYVADGLVLASATGSTGYALAAGGPIVSPQLDAIIVQPVAPHLTNLRSLVVPGSSLVRVVMNTIQPGVLTVDGHVDYAFANGQEVTISTAVQRTVFARRGKRSEFYEDLGVKLTR